MRIYDDVLPTHIASELASTIMGTHFPWYANHGVNEKNATMGQFQFTHTFYCDYGWTSDYAPLLYPLVNILNPLSIIRIKANLLTWVGQPLRHGSHVDCDDSRVTTGVYYVNDNNGYTSFDSGEIVESTANRLVVFPATMPHSGVTATNSNYRYVININYISNDTLRSLTEVTVE